MPMLRRNSVFAAKTETTIGTAETLTGAEGVYNARDFMIQPSIGMTRREGQGGFNYLESVPEGMMGTCTMTHDLTYNGTDIPTWASVLLPACGFVDSSGVFSPKSSAPGGSGLPKTLTIGHYYDGKLRRLAGAMGNFVINCPTGQVATIAFTFTGKYFEDESDVTLIAPTYPNVLPLRFADATVTWDSVPVCSANISVDAGNSVIMRECVAAGDRTGYVSALITNRAPVITADIESVLAATQDRDSQWLGMDTEAFTITINGTGNSTLVISAPAAQIENKQHGNRNDIVIDDTTWFATAGSSVDTELTITFNAAT